VTPRITRVSTQCPITAVSAAAASRTKISTSLKWARKRSQAGLLFFSGSALGPKGPGARGLGGAQSLGATLVLRQYLFNGLPVGWLRAVSPEGNYWG
jgi:hypothetical protein